MDWKKDWEGKKVFVKLKTGAVYTGTVLQVDQADRNIVFFKLLDKFGNLVTFVHSEIIKIVQERFV